MVTLMAVALVAVFATGCKREITKEVLFVNDSVTHQSIINIVEQMNSVPNGAPAARYAPTFGSSIPGAGLLQIPGVPPEDVKAYWHAHLTSLIEHVNPEVLVVELGYNDCGRDLADYPASIDNFMDNIPAETPVHWLTMADVNNQRTCDETINAALNDATSRFSNLSLFDFAAHSQGHPEWSVDGTHLSADGRADYASWLHAQLDAIYDQPDPEPEPEPQALR
jgi:hypothetical protein